jgi:hypothetical protein
MFTAKIASLILLATSQSVCSRSCSPTVNQAWWSLLLHQHYNQHFNLKDAPQLSLASLSQTLVLGSTLPTTNLPMGHELVPLISRGNYWGHDYELQGTVQVRLVPSC